MESFRQSIRCFGCEKYFPSDENFAKHLFLTDKAHGNRDDYQWAFNYLFGTKQPLKRCFVCQSGFVNFDSLAKHILQSNDQAHQKNKSTLDWARRYSNGIKHAPKRISRIPIAQGEVCPICKKPFEGNNPEEVCQC